MPKFELLQGTLDLLVLKVLQAGPQHGFGIAQRIHLLSQEVLRVEEGSLYPALYRLEGKSWIESEWGQSENNRRAKFYSLTKAGRKQLAAEEQTWDAMAAAIAQVLRRAETSQ
jgi:PadR family transcriptional regulator, regulatory protein PadR